MVYILKIKYMGMSETFPYILMIYIKIILLFYLKAIIAYAVNET
ncbi:hypothetical protein HMPREF1705_04656 [Acetomicrobium hydrogeniformans ATCC BAA-1850]|uniref:Uncharacterized protein n=1 Tax=Acetomicrobium hydrogeniformans ATCC BAA-1850 TaxID=592015 RepID=A0A0T5XAH4_9BACT|nr:hypothetical protein HMPREF1705_04656 [Acetomicrobium hydrogeniformans ATCC BAA-1850]